MLQYSVPHHYTLSKHMHRNVSTFAFALCSIPLQPRNAVALGVSEYLRSKIALCEQDSKMLPLTVKVPTLTDHTHTHHVSCGSLSHCLTAIISRCLHLPAVVCLCGSLSHCLDVTVSHCHYVSLSTSHCVSGQPHFRMSQTSDLYQNTEGV